MSDVHHSKILLAILQHRWAEAEELVGRQPVDYAGFVPLCKECEVDTWVHATLAREKRLDLIGEDAAAQLGQVRNGIQRKNLFFIATAQNALDILNKVGIVPVVLKGLDLIHRLYQFDERTLRDVDILISPKDVPKALDALLAQGWQAPPEPKRTHYFRSSHHIPIFSPGEANVNFEIHWNLASPRWRVDADELIERSLPLDVGGRKALRLEDHDFVAHLLLHHFTHYFERRMKWAVDMHLIARQPDFDWQRPIEQVKAWGAAAASSGAVMHLTKCFPDWIPDELRRGLPVDRWRQWLLKPLLSDHPLDLCKNTRSRRVQLYLASVFYERPADLPGWLFYRSRRENRPGEDVRNAE